MTRPLAWALLVGALVRLPGVAWGVNFPDGFAVHHPDEYTHVAIAEGIVGAHIAPAGTAYPKGMAALAAAPIVVWNGLHGRIAGERPRLSMTAGLGRLLSVAFGVAAIALVFLIGRDALGSRVAGLAAAWLLALGGLHVTQSHFFLADAAATACTLLAAWLIWRYLGAGDEGRRTDSLNWAAFASGAAVALKLAPFSIPALVYAVLMRPARLTRALQVVVFAVAGASVTTMGWMTPIDYYQALTRGVTFAFEHDRLRGLLLYAIELPGILTLPLLLLAAAGSIVLVGRLRRTTPARRRDALAVLSIPFVAVLFTFVKLDHFPRHLVVAIPWVALAGGWSLAILLRWCQRAGRSRLIILVPVFGWMAAFAIDTERWFLFDPRNEAAEWLRANVDPGSAVYWTRRRPPSGFTASQFPPAGDPDVLVIEMYDANNFLSGLGWRDSYPTDYRRVFSAESADQLAQYHALFRGDGPFVEAARFPARYWMPEHLVADYLIGDRARTYVSDVVVFRQRPATVPVGARTR